MRAEAIALGVSASALAASFFGASEIPVDPAWISIVLCGFPILKDAFTGLFRYFDIKANLLVSLALMASVWIGEYFAAGEIALIMGLGELLEHLTVSKARAGIEKLVHLTPRTARVIKDGEKTVIPAQEVKVGDMLQVLPGETVPVDGVICSGRTSIDQSIMTGESMPVDKAPGDSVSSGTVNRFGSFEMRAEKVGSDSSIQRMIRLVKSADAGKARIVALADRWATWIVAISLTGAALTWFFTGELVRSVTVLVVFCPCSLVLSTPTAIMAAIGNATGHGFLTRRGDALERLAMVKKIAFDKTGTLTFGKPKVIGVKSLSDNYTDHEIYSMTASAEQNSEHPLGKAIVESYKNSFGGKIQESSDFKMIPGRGVSVNLQGKEILAGNGELLREQAVDLKETKEAEEYLKEGFTVIYVAVDRVFSGILALSDTVRPGSMALMDSLSSAGTPALLLTGDNERTANHIAKELHIKEVKANCRPEDKLEYIGQAQRDETPICMVGDGINDAPALKKAMVGIAMGGVGSDIAVEAADIALVNDDIKELPHLIMLSKRMMRTIKLNILFSIGLNILAIGLAMKGAMTPVAGALVHNAGSLAVIFNSTLLLKWGSSHSFE